MQMEKDGEEFYRYLIRRVDNVGLKTIFTMLADDEVKHYNALEQIQEQQTEMLQTSILADAKNVFEEMRQSGQFQINLKQVDIYFEALDIENKSKEFYQQKAYLVDEPGQKELFEQLAAEEDKHIFLIENVIDFVDQPQHWLENAEFNHLEDY